jgi:hypothetical protein
MKVIYYLALCIGICASGNALSGPFDVYPFKIPEQYQSQLKNYRTDWHRVTGFEHSGLHWQQFILVFINRQPEVYERNYMEYLRYYQDYDEDEEELSPPEFKHYSAGTIVLKENFSAQSGSPQTALTVTMMLKREKGYSPEFGDWEYAQFDREGNVLLRGKGSQPEIKKACADCHSSIAERDYIFANFFSRNRVGAK